jgi:hypothetical protein
MSKYITPKGVTDLLYQFDDVKGIAMGHVIADSGRDNLYVVLVRVAANESSTADLLQDQLYSATDVDSLDQGVSGHLTDLLRHPIAFDGCSGGLSKPHCAGPTHNCRRRIPDVPHGEELAVAERQHTLVEAEPFLSSAVPAERLDPIFDVMDRLSFHGFGKCKPKH